MDVVFLSAVRDDDAQRAMIVVEQSTKGDPARRV
jgi:hypothetical protein